MLRKATVVEWVQTSLSVLSDLIHILTGNLIAIECKSRLVNPKTYFLPYLISRIMYQLKALLIEKWNDASTPEHMDVPSKPGHKIPKSFHILSTTMRCRYQNAQWEML